MLEEYIKDLDTVKEKIKPFLNIVDSIDPDYLFLVDDAHLESISNPAYHFPVYYLFLLRTSIMYLGLIDSVLFEIKKDISEYKEVIGRLKSRKKQESMGAIFELYVIGRMKNTYLDQCEFFPKTKAGRPDCAIKAGKDQLFIEVSTMGQTNTDNTNQDDDIRQGGGVHSRDPYHDKIRIESKVLEKLEQLESDKHNMLFICLSDIFPLGRPIEWALNNLRDSGDLNKVSHVFIFKFNGVEFGLDRCFDGRGVPIGQNDIDKIKSLFEIPN